MPNTFTPNNDARNDEFKGVGYTSGMTQFQMHIYNRWGECIFKTNDYTEGWNGAKNNTGEQLPEGVYLYKVQYITPTKQTIYTQGYVNLVR